MAKLNKTALSPYSPGGLKFLESPHVAEEQKLRFANEVGRLSEVVRRMPGDDQSVMLELFKEIDKNLDEQTAKHHNISCRRGCSFCCYVPVQVTPDEADILAKKMQTLAYDHDRLKIQANNRIQDEKQTLPKEHAACVFLDGGGMCKVYDIRPIACRLHYVTSSPELCDTTTDTPDQRVQKLVLPKAEALASGIYHAMGAEYMPLALLERLKKDDDEAVSIEPAALPDALTES